MPITLPKPEPDAAPVPTPNRIRWTRQQCDAIRDAGILTGRYELIDGEIISKMGQKPPHPYMITALLVWLSRIFGADHIRIQSSLRLEAGDGEYNEPEPDVAITIPPYTAFSAQHPNPGDVLLVVEVSDTTLRFDLTTKAALYARAGIPEYWVMDVAGRQAIAHRNPNAEGYQEITAYAENELVTPLARHDSSVRVADLLPPA
jgi:Uma2 family endonuclease